ncbi:MAG TPA: Lrp/AsnC family transcriptional regulator [Verrucomicrobiae bacterium]|nr:Lrp/AsnC family transcriptional regulator [Verrucomicrobiae bacterium]
MMLLDNVDKKLLNLIQVEVPITTRPFEALGEKLGGLSEPEMLERVKALKERRIIRQISAIFDTRSLGYTSSLVAVKCDPSREDEVAAIISAHPGVSHNYKRSHTFNLWYTIAVAPTSKLGLERTVQILHEVSGAMSSRLMPTLHLFKIGVELDVEEIRKADDKTAVSYTQRNRSVADGPLSDLEIRFVREMQKDLTIEAEPFLAVTARLGVSFEKLQQLAATMTSSGRMRRFSAVLHHREIGFNANGMGVWVVRGTNDEILRTGEKMATFRAVTHCYLRPAYPDWPYNIFTMIHARTNDECNAVVDQIAKETGVRDHEVLYSTKEYKKSRVRYFTEAEVKWELKFTP